jgi:hypothetical protein
MTFNLDLLASKPVTDSERMLQLGDVIEIDNISHIEAVRDAIELLSPQSKFCIEAIFYEGVPYSKLGGRLGVSKPHAWRLAQKAIKELNALLINNKAINERYTMFDTWDEAVESVVLNFNNVSDKRKVQLDELNKYVQNMWNYSRDLVYEEATFLDMNDLGRLATSHLKSIDSWDAQSTIDLMIKKQHDYGHNNILGFGLLGLCIRMSDKIARLVSLEKRGSKPHNESVVDTWTDIVGYATIAKMLENGTFNLELKDQK